MNEAATDAMIAEFEASLAENDPENLTRVFDIEPSRHPQFAGGEPVWKAHVAQLRSWDEYTIPDFFPAKLETKDWSGSLFSADSLTNLTVALRELARPIFNKDNAVRQALRERLLTQVLVGETTEKTVSIEYAGSGDSGGIEDSSIDDNEVTEFLWSCLWKFHSGFENNEGGQGTVTWDLVKDEITIDHGENVVTVESMEHVI